jgi:acyl-CoA reductase-like NAD-dependent aldehyde dehydrogenase
MTTFMMTIDGQAVAPDRVFAVTNPATENVAGEAPACTPEQLDMAMEAAQRAFRSWAADEDERRAALVRAADAVVAAADQIAHVLTSENGKPLRRATEEVYGVAAWLKYYAAFRSEPEVIRPNASTMVEVRRRPIGVVAAIAPWNYPLVLSAWKLAPALLAGNTVVLKPSPFTPLATLLAGGVLANELPPGVLNVVSGGDELGAWMTKHPTPRKISFTGSVSTGKAVAIAGAADLKRVTLELGGNDAAILLDDIDVEHVTAGVFAAAFQNSGQVCSAIKRVYVPESHYDDVVEALAERAKSAVVGDPTAETTEFGPVSNEPQYRRVLGLLDDALRDGAQAAAGGGALDGPGYFVSPTVLRDVQEGVRIVDEEQFGPVVPVIAYRDEDDALARANDTMYGLGGSVWSSDPDRAAELASQLECGTAWVNQHLGLAPYQPFGGVKWSGVGVENGHWGYDEFTDLQVLSRPFSPSAEEMIQ